MEKVLSTISQKMGHDGAKFMEDIHKFINRPGLPTDRVERALGHMIEMLEKPSELDFAKLNDKHLTGEAAQKYGEQLKLLAAKGFAHHLANPNTLSIGHHYTCNVTAVEGVLLSRFPDQAADMLKQALQTGKLVHKGPDGKPLEVEPDGKPLEINLNPKSFAWLGKEEKTWPTDDNQRTLDSKVLVHALMSDIGGHLANSLTYWEENGPKADETNPGPAYWTDKSGKRIKDEDGKALSYHDEVFGKHACVPAWLLGAELYRLTGEKDNIVVESGAYDREYANRAEKWRDRYGLNYDDYVKRIDADKVESYLAERAAEGRLPVVFAGSSTMLSNLMPTQGERNKPSKFSKVEDPLGTHDDHYFLVYMKDGKIGLTNNWGSGVSEGYPVTPEELKTIISPDDKHLEKALQQYWGKEEPENEALAEYLDDRLERLGKPKRHKPRRRHNGH
jgi:hypothetical protein